VNQNEAFGDCPLASFFVKGEGMDTLKDIRDVIQDFIEDMSIATVMDNYINFALKDAESIIPFSALFGTTDMTPDSSGVLKIPPRCRKITRITSVKSDAGPADRTYHPTRQRPTADEARKNWYWYLPYPASETDENLQVVSITQGSASIQAAEDETTFFTADDIGSELNIEGDSEEYVITAFTEGDTDTITVYPRVASATNTSVNAVIGIAGRERNQLLTNAIIPSTEEVSIEYQKRHPLLIEDEDRLLIPCPRTIAYMAIQLCQQTNKYDVDADRLERKLLEAKNSEIGQDTYRNAQNERQDNMFSFRSKRGRRRC
jgi:hypothetical protein